MAMPYTGHMPPNLLEIDCRAAMYYKPSNITQPNELEVDPPRTRIAVACNRCRRRKIKCSGSPEGGSCEGCIRANGAECVFADRPQLSRGSSAEDSPTALSNPGFPPSSVPSQPPALPRSASLPTHQIVTRPMPERQMRSLSATSMTHLEAPPTSSPNRSHGPNSPTTAYSMSPPISTKRQSLTSGNHPYQRPGSGSYRKSSGDQVAANLQRYSQSLIRAQSMQLSGRPQQQPRSASTSGRMSFPSRGSAAASPQQEQLSLQMQMQMHQQQAMYGNSSFQLQPALAQVPNFRQPDYNTPTTPSAVDFSAPPEYIPNHLLRNDAGTPESIAYSPIYENSIYSVSTPELMSSESISTIESSFSRQYQPVYTSQAALPYANQSIMNLDFPHPAGNAPLVDPGQWTPGVDKMATQWLQFSPQNDNVYFG